MSVCVEGLIRNDFYDVDNIEAVEAELNRASNILNDYFCLEDDDRYHPEGLDCGDYQVYSETHYMYRMFLRKGSTYLLRSFTLQLCDLIIWYRNYLREHTDYELNALEWDVVDKNAIRK